MDESTALAIFEDFLRMNEGQLGILLAEVPTSRKRLSTGWAFYYQSQAYVEGGSFSDLLVGHGPVVISDDGRLLEGGSLDSDAEALLTTGKPFVTRMREGK
jgi:hypothetical protein